MAEIRVPTLGKSVTEATIGRWFKKAGDAVRADEALAELETDKVTLEVNAPAAGVLAEIVAKEGETVGPGALLGQIAEGAAAPAKSGETAGKSPAPKPAPAPAAPAPKSAPGCAGRDDDAAGAVRRQDRRRAGDRHRSGSRQRQARSGAEVGRRSIRRASGGCPAARARRPRPGASGAGSANRGAGAPRPHSRRKTPAAKSG